MFSARYTPGSGFNTDNINNETKLNKFPFKRKRYESSDSESSSSSDSEVENEEEDISMQESESETSENEGIDQLNKSSTEALIVSTETKITTSDSGIESSKYFTPEAELLETNKHSSILERFKQTVTMQDSLPEETNLEPENDVELHDLVPIPQPAKVFLPRTKQVFLNESWSHLNKIFYNMTAECEWSKFHEQKLINDTLYENIINNMKFEKTMPVQTTIFENYLPMLLKNYSISKSNYTSKSGDVLINSFTGSGKTLAYLIPILEVLMSRRLSKLRCVIVLPTTILIQQVYTTIIKLIKNSDLVVATSKPNSTSLKEEIEKFKNLKLDILISTPGRLVDHLNSGSISFQDLKFLVMDESDKLLNQSYQDWVNIVMKSIEQINVTKFVVSATLTKNTEKLELLKLNPIRTNLFLLKDEEENDGNEDDDKDHKKDGIYQLPNGLQEYSIKLKFKDSLYKPMFLAKLLNFIQTSSNISKKILVFVNSNQSSLRLTPLLEKIVSQYNNNTSVYSINSNNTNMQNKQALENFNANDSGKSTVLVTTDVMSRGIDLQITDVINYNLPISSQQYVHRIGRTARGVNKDIGNVYNIFVGNDDYKYYTKQIDRYLKRFSNKDIDFQTIVENNNMSLQLLSESIDEKNKEATLYREVLREFYK
ncbi:hypothetical protein QEN19_000986 [Hanseniaspora menglaensis]